MMTCREITGFLSDYLAGDLPDHVSGAFEGHLHGCGTCREFLVQFEETVTAGCRAFDGQDAPAALPEDLVRAILAALKEPPPADEP